MAKQLITVKDFCLLNKELHKVKERLEMLEKDPMENFKRVELIVRKREFFDAVSAFIAAKGRCAGSSMETYYCKQINCEYCKMVKARQDLIDSIDGK